MWWFFGWQTKSLQDGFGDASDAPNTLTTFKVADYIPRVAYTSLVSGVRIRRVRGRRTTIWVSSTLVSNIKFVWGTVLDAGLRVCGLVASVTQTGIHAGCVIASGTQSLTQASVGVASHAGAMVSNASGAAFSWGLNVVAISVYLLKLGADGARLFFASIATMTELANRFAISLSERFDDSSTMLSHVVKRIDAFHTARERRRAEERMFRQRMRIHALS